MAVSLTTASAVGRVGVLPTVAVLVEAAQVLIPAVRFIATTTERLKGLHPIATIGDEIAVGLDDGVGSYPQTAPEPTAASAYAWYSGAGRQTKGRFTSHEKGHVAHTPVLAVAGSRTATSITSGTPDSALPKNGHVGYEIGRLLATVCCSATSAALKRATWQARLPTP